MPTPPVVVSITGKYCGPDSPFNRTGEWDSVFVAFSRDGFHWSRPVVDGGHRVFLPMSDAVAPPWVWNKANVQSVGGGFVVQDPSPPSPSPLTSATATAMETDEEDNVGTLRFYVGARTGPGQLEGWFVYCQLIGCHL